MKKLPYGFPFAVLAIIASLSLLSLSPLLNQNGGFELFESVTATVLLVFASASCFALAVAALVKMFIMNRKENE